MATGITVKLNFSDKKLNAADDVADLLQQIRDNEDKLETLDLAGNSYGIEASRAIGDVLQMCSQVKHLHMNNMFISRLKDEIPEALRLIFGGVMASGARIVSLNLNDNAIGPVTMPALLPFLQSENCSELKCLYLNNCGLGIKGGSMLAGVLSKLENLTELVIGRNRLEIDGILEISQALCKLHSLELLELPQNGTKGKAITFLCEAIKLNPNLRVLNLNDNVLSYSAAELADALKTLNNLEVLNLGDCLLKTKGCIEVMLALKHLCQQSNGCKIREINLSGNEIGKAAQEILINSIEFIIQNQSYGQLKLDLNLNNFGESAVEQINERLARTIELILEEDQGSEDENEAEEAPEADQVTGEELDVEKIAAQLERQYKNVNGLAVRFYKVATDGFKVDNYSLSEVAQAELEAIIKVGQKVNPEHQMDFVNALLVACGLIKGEDKSLSPLKNASTNDLSAALFALAFSLNHFNSFPEQKRIMRQLIKEKAELPCFSKIKMAVFPYIFRF